MPQNEKKKPYHHGNLRDAVLDEVLKQTEDAGPEQVSLRAVARELGVSPGATFRHFKDRRAVITALAVRGIEGMLAEIADMQAQVEQTPMAQFAAIGRGYLSFALENPALFRLMFRETLIDPEDPAYQEIAPKLEAMMGPPGGVDTGGLLAWGVVHGLATLSIEGALDGMAPRDQHKAILGAALAGMGPVFRD